MTGKILELQKIWRIYHIGGKLCSGACHLTEWY